MLTKKIEKELLFEILLFSAGIALISLLWKDNAVLTALLLLGWLFALKSWHKRHDVYFFVAGAVTGPIGEIVAVHFGAWQYSNPTFLGIPLWLPLAWGLGSVLIKRFAEIFVKIEAK